LGTGASIYRQDPATGQPLEPEVATHEVGVAEFASGVVATLSVSFDEVPAGTPSFELYGSEGTLRLPDPSFETGELLAYRRTTGRWMEHRLDPLDALPARCAGVVDMAAAIAEERPHRASGELGFHVLEALLALRRSAALGRLIRLRSRCDRPDPLPEAPGDIACDPPGQVR
jgi:predicted dehydrogenase